MLVLGYLGGVTVEADFVFGAKEAVYKQRYGSQPFIINKVPIMVGFQTYISRVYDL